MNVPRLDRIDWSKFRGPYPVAAFVVATVLVLLAAWLLRATSVGERVTIGVLMTVVALSVLVALVVLSSRSSDPVRIDNNQPPLAPGLISATSKDIADPETDQLAGPGGHFLINKPPPDWSTRVVSANELIRERLKVSEAMAANLTTNFPAAAEQNILVMDGPRTASIVPRIGVTRLNGRKWPSAREFTAVTELSVSPMPRAQPPLYMRRPLIHNFLIYLAGLLNSTGGLANVKDLDIFRSGKPNSIRLTAILEQSIAHAEIDGEEDRSVELTIIAMALPGGAIDHVILLSYYSIEGEQPNSCGETLTSLANSFKSLTPADPSQQEQHLRRVADESFETHIQGLGESLFTREAILTISGIIENDLDDPSNLKEATRLLTPFCELANFIGLDPDSEWMDLLAAIDDARHGDFADLRSELVEMMDVFEQT